MKYLQDEYYDKVNMRIFMKIAIEIKIIMLPLLRATLCNFT